MIGKSTCLVMAVALVAYVPLSAFAQDSFGEAPVAKPHAPPKTVAHPQTPGARQTPPPQQPAPPHNAPQDALAATERQDFGIHPVGQLHNGPMHAPTPASIPGGQVITTKGLRELVQGRRAPFLLFDALGGPETLPGAIPASFYAQPGDFGDQVSQQFGYNLQQATQGRKDIALVFYCQSTHCWMSYNAALRAIHLGYANVLWYRGGLDAWKAAGLQTQPAQQSGYGNQQY